MKEISYKELRNLPFGTKIRETSSLSDKVHDGVIANGKIIYENGSACNLEHIEYSEDISYANSGYSIIKFYILEDIHELMWNDLKKLITHKLENYEDPPIYARVSMTLQHQSEGIRVHTHMKEYIENIERKYKEIEVDLYERN